MDGEEACLEESASEEESKVLVEPSHSTSFFVELENNLNEERITIRLASPTS